MKSKLVGIKRLGKPRKVELDLNLVLQAERKRYDTADFSAAHWMVQVIALYREGIGPFRAAAERVLRAFISGGDKAARKEAALLPDCGLPDYLTLPVGDWSRIRKECQKNWAQISRQFQTSD